MKIDRVVESFLWCCYNSLFLPHQFCERRILTGFIRIHEQDRNNHCDDANNICHILTLQEGGFGGVQNLGGVGALLLGDLYGASKGFAHGCSDLLGQVLRLLSRQRRKRPGEIVGVANGEQSAHNRYANGTTEAAGEVIDCRADARLGDRYHV
jgi:hypothetical protein